MPARKTPEKKRLDLRCVELGLAPSRQHAQALILAGEILVDGQQATKAGLSIADSALLTHQGAGLPYVSRGGLKLAAALDSFQLDPAGCIALDVGASTGGFTDCLLQRGARHLIALDVGFGQLDWKLRNHPQVTAVERTNIRYVTADALRQRLPSPDLWPPELVTIDVSFISLKRVLPVIATLLAPARPVIALVKPQFEAGKGQVGKGGVVRDDALRQQAIDGVLAFAAAQGFTLHGQIDSPIRGPKGNLEHWIFLRTPAQCG